MELINIMTIAAQCDIISIPYEGKPFSSFC